MPCGAGWGESGDGTKNGITTNMHITSSLVDGPVPKELCIIPTLREHDFGGQLNRGHLTGGGGRGGGAQLVSQPGRAGLRWRVELPTA